jgi:hypothetical protein
MRVDVCVQFTTKNKNSVRKKIVRERYVFAGPVPPALWVPLPALWVLPAASRRTGQRPPATVPHVASWRRMRQVKRSACRWVIWVIWVIVLNCKLAPVAGWLWVIWVIVFCVTQMT